MKENTKTTVLLWKRIFEFVKPYKKWVFFRVSFSSINAVISIVNAFMTAKMIEAATDKNIDKLYMALLILLVSISVEMLSIIFSGICSGRFSSYSIRDLRNKLFRHMESMPIPFVEKNHSGDISSRLTNDINVIQDFLSHNLTEYLYQPLRFFAAVIFMLFINWKLLLFSCFVLPFAIYLTEFFSKPITKNSSGVQSSLGKINTSFQDMISGIHIMKAFNLKEIIYSKFTGDIDEYYQSGLRLEKNSANLELVRTFSHTIPFVFCYLFGGYLALKGELAISELIFFTTSMHYLIMPVSSIPRLFGAFKRATAAAKRIFELLETKVEENGNETGLEDNAHEIIAVKNVSFSYNTGEKVLNNINFALEKNSVTALVGSSGSGKSTLFKLLCGFYKDYSGEINILNVEMKKWDLHSLRNKISMVTQDAFLFPTTIYENIALGKETTNMEEVIAAAAKANAHDFICEQPGSYDTYVGERGTFLSGGQKQRITIARAILKESSILFLDEPTSALDTVSEALVQQAIENMLENKTVFVIAHRLSTIKKASKIIVLDNGEIIDSGTHEELMDRCPLYQKLYTKEADL